MDSAEVPAHHAAAIKQYRAAKGQFLALGNEGAALRTSMQIGQEVFARGDLSDGIGILKEALADARDLESPQYLIWATGALADAYYFHEDFDEAMEVAREGIEVASTYALDLSGGEAAIARASLAHPQIGLQAAYRAALSRKGEARSEAWRAAYGFLEAGRAVELLAALGGRAAVGDAQVDPELRETEQRLRSAEAMAYANYRAARRAAGPGSFQAMVARKKELKDAQEKLAEVVRSIQRQARMQADLAYSGGSTLEEVQGALLADEAMVLYETVADQQSFAFVITPKQVRVQGLGSRDELVQAVSNLLGEHKQPIRPTGIAPLRKLIVDPLGLDKAIRRVMVSPNAELAFVPFALLDTSRDLIHVPSATVYGEMRRVRQPDPGRLVLALGDPDYKATGPSRGPRTRGARGGALPRLVDSGKEVEAICRKDEGDIVLTRAAASETRFLEELRKQERWRSIHFACHGLIDPEDPTRCSLELAADGVNDGSLWALDVFRMRMPADLVVLSGCNTGKGRVVRGEGIVGLARAFLQAGAPRVIASLWEVDDAATRALMTKFYELWRPKDGSPGQPTATALRLAQQHVRSQKDKGWDQPKYWSAWTLWGLPD